MRYKNFGLVTCLPADCLLRAKIELSTAQTYCPTVARGVSFLLATPFRAFGFRFAWQLLSGENKEKTYQQNVLT